MKTKLLFTLTAAFLLLKPAINFGQVVNLGTAANFVIFSSNGEVTNTGISYFKGDIGTNVGLATGFDSANVTGTIHPIPDVFTAACVTDLLIAYNYLNTLPYDSLLPDPAQFGNKMILTPNIYRMNAATTFTDTLFLDAQGDANAVFVIQINGALLTSTKSKVILLNFAQAKNIYWKVDGAVSIADSSVFIGTIICNNGAIEMKTGVTLDGRALTTKGAIGVTEINATSPTGSGSTAIASSTTGNTNNTVTIYPNPFTSSTDIVLNVAMKNNMLQTYELRIYNIRGELVLLTAITDQVTTLQTSNLPSGNYFYRIINNNKTVQSGKLVSQQ